MVEGRPSLSDPGPYMLTVSHGRNPRAHSIKDSETRCRHVLYGVWQILLQSTRRSSTSLLPSLNRLEERVVLDGHAWISVVDTHGSTEACRALGL